MEKNRHLLQPLISPSAADSPPLDNDNLISSNSGIALRLTLVAFIGIVSIWAKHEASKGYAITIVNESTNTFLAKRFHLFYVSNDEATRMVIKASNIIQDFLFPNSRDDNSLKKPIKSVVLKLVNANLTDSVMVEKGNEEDQFVLSISHRVMGGSNFGRGMARAIRRGVARLWLWDGRGNAPDNLINGIVEYLVNSLDINSGDAAELFEPATACWDANRPRLVAEFLKRGERRHPGFVRRLNRAMKDGWNDEKLGGALGLPVQSCMCNVTSHESLLYNSSSV